VKKLKRKLFPGKSRLEKRGEYNLVESFKDHAEMTSIRKKFTNLSKSTSTSSSSTSSTSSSSTSSSTIATTKVDDAVQLEEEDRVGYVDDEEDDYDDQDKYELMEVFGNAFTELHEKKSQNTSLTPISIDTFTDTDDDNDENECYPGVDLNESDDDFDMHLNGLMPRDYHYDPASTGNGNKKRTRRTFIKLAVFPLIYLIAWIPGFIYRFSRYFWTFSAHTHFVIDTISVVSIGSIGMFNFIFLSCMNKEVRNFLPGWNYCCVGERDPVYSDSGTLISTGSLNSLTSSLSARGSSSEEEEDGGEYIQM